MSSYLSRFIFLILIVVFESVRSIPECPVNLKLLCNEQKSCDECIQAHHCCHWCYDQTNFSGIRCNFLKEIESQCGQKIERNRETSLEKTENRMFTQIRKATDATNAIQIRPQSFKVVLRKGSPVNLTFTYKAAKNYPLELYYLGDLSYSMRNHLETLKNLGDDLGRSLENLTLNYKLAYGSFLDKPGMPFVYTDDKNMDNPCQTDKEKCEPAYLFKHRLNFTNTARFFDKVKKSRISANVDDMDGALEAIFQILVCDKNFGWTEQSRKLIVLSTDSLLHTAGDGILAGAILRNDHLCLVDKNGDHMYPLKYDYPSVGQIKILLEKFKVNLIIAVTREKLNFYETMKKDILDENAFVGELKENSANILELVNRGFHNFIRQVQFSSNTSHAPELEVKFFADCYRLGHFNESSGCQNVEEETSVNFKLQLTLKEITSKKTEQIFIKEKSINENIQIDIEYAGCNCDCENFERIDLTMKCENGYFSCGSCKCQKGWAGLLCSEECTNDLKPCRDDYESARTCSGRGDCICNKCDCENPYTGDFCQFECPTDKKGQICSGHGTCFEGACNCDEDFAGNDCSCEISTEGCKLTGSDSICNGQGLCECNVCYCESGFEGNYCEKTKGENVLCDMYENYVKDYAENNTSTFYKNNVIILVEDLGDYKCDDECSTVFFSGTAQRCFIDYCYHRGDNNSIHLGTKNKSCIVTAEAMAMGTAIGIFFTILLAGIVIVLLKKYQIYKMDQAEYKKFLDEHKRCNELNPIYRSPVTQFTNPLAK